MVVDNAFQEAGLAGRRGILPRSLTGSVSMDILVLQIVNPAFTMESGDIASGGGTPVVASAGDSP
jgi:hypothetical protein